MKYEFVEDCFDLNDKWGLALRIEMPDGSQRRNAVRYDGEPTPEARKKARRKLKDWANEIIHG